MKISFLFSGENKRSWLTKWDSVWENKRAPTRIRTYSDLVVWNNCDFRGVALHDGRKPYFKLSLDVTISSLHNPRLLTPGYKVLVLVHTGHHLEHLLWSIPKQWDEVSVLIQSCEMFLSYCYSHITSQGAHPNVRHSEYSILRVLIGTARLMKLRLGMHMDVAGLRGRLVLLTARAPEEPKCLKLQQVDRLSHVLLGS